MPDGQAVFRQGAAHHRQGGGGQQRAYRLGREDAHHQAGKHQQFDRRTHPAWRFVRGVREVLRSGAEEHIDGETQGIGHAEGAGQGGDDRQRGLDPGSGADEHRFGEEHFLGQETVHQRHAGHRRAGHHGQGGGVWHQAYQPAEAADVTGTAFVVDDAGGHEQRGLEGGVVENVEHRRDGGQRAVQAQQQGNQAQVADGRVRQQALEVVLEHGGEGAEQEGESAGTADYPEPLLAARQHRPQAREQEHPGLDHGRRVQIGRYRSGRCHGMGQPELEGELCALAQGANEDQWQQHRVQGMLADGVAGSQDLVQVVAADHMAEQQGTHQQAQAARARDHQRHVGAAAGVGTVVPVADQQEREQAGEFPEEHQLDQVAGDHQAEHGAHEGEEEGEEARHRVLWRHVIAGIQRHQRTDAQHQQREQPGEAVHAQHQVQPQAGQPEEFFANHAAVGNLRVQQCYLDSADQGHEPGENGLRVTCVVRQHGCQATAHERQKQ